MPGSATYAGPSTIHYGLGTGTLANREDLLDLISIVQPDDAPFVIRAGRTRATAITHSWLTETLEATNASGAVEGANWALDSTTQPARNSNRLMIQRKDIQTSETQRSVNMAGAKDAYQREIMKAYREISRNQEVVIMASGAASGVVGTSGTARVAAGLAYFQNTAATTGTGGTVYFDAQGGTITGSGGNNGNINGLLQYAWANGADPETIFVNSIGKRAISQLTAPQQNRNIDAADRRLVGVVDFYDSDFGKKQIVLDRWVHNATAVSTATNAAYAHASGIHMWMLTMEYNRLAYLRPLAHVLIGRLGDSVAGYVLHEWTLEVLNPSANFLVYGLTA